MSFLGRHRILVLLVLPFFMGAVWLVYEVWASLNAKPAPDTDYGAQMRALMLEAQQVADGPARDDVRLAEAWREFSAELTQVSGSIETLLFESIEAAELPGTPFIADRGYDWSVVTDTDSWREQAADSPPGDLTSEQALAELESVHAALAVAAESEVAAEAFASLLARARSGEPLVRPYSSRQLLINQLLPELGQYRRMAQFSVAWMEHAVQSEDWQAYAEGLEASLWMAELAASDPVIIGNLVGVAIESLMLERVRNDVLRGRLPAEVLGRVDELIKQHERPDLAFSLRGERTWALDAVQWMHDSRGRLLLSRTGTLTMGVGGSRVMNLGSIAFPRRAETEARFKEFYGRMIEAAEMPIAAAKVELASLDQEIDGLSGRQVLLGMLAPAIGKAVSVSWSADLNRAGLLTLLAIERYRVATGVLPASLDEMMPVYLDAVPMDPFAAGETLVYRLDDTESLGGVGYVLYSVGPDGVDDGGVVGDNPLVRYRRGADGLDWMLTRSAEPGP
ncbi:MAG: hypothetical protein AAGF47_01640 [Planctomycetota bacterium]